MGSSAFLARLSGERWQPSSRAGVATIRYSRGVGVSIFCATYDSYYNLLYVRPRGKAREKYGGSSKWCEPKQIALNFQETQGAGV